MAITLSGRLYDPFGNALENAGVRFTAARTSTQVLANYRAETTTDSSGDYTITVQYATYHIEARQSASDPWYTIARSIPVTTETTSTDINALIVAYVGAGDATPEIVLEIEAITAQASQAASEATASASSAAQSASDALAAADGSVRYALTTGALAETSAGFLVDGRGFVVTETDRRGEFVWLSGDYSSEVSGDPQQGIYIAPSGGNGSTGVWRRIISGVGLNPLWFGAVGNGANDDTEAVQACLDALVEYQAMDLPAGPYKFYCADKLYLRNTYTGIGAMSIRGVGGTARLSSGASDIALEVSGPYGDLGGGNMWFWEMSDIYFSSVTATTMLKAGGGDTWHGTCRRVWFAGSTATTTHNVLLTNDDPDAYRDYFLLFERCVFRNGDYLLSIGSDFSTGSEVKCQQAVNRVKVTDCDFYGHGIYGIYIGETQAGDACNGHTFKGIHFDSAQAGAIADIRWRGPFTSVDGVFESGANHWIDFSDTEAGGCLVGAGLKEAVSKFAVGGVAINDDFIAIGDMLGGLVAVYNTALRSFVTSPNVQTNRIRGYSNQNLELTPTSGNDLVIGKYYPETNTRVFQYRYKSDGVESLSGSGSGTDGSLSITRDTSTDLSENNDVEIYEAHVYMSSSPSNNAFSKRLIKLYGTSGITESDLSTTESGTTYTATFSRPSADVIQASWTGFKAVRVKLVRIS